MDNEDKTVDETTAESETELEVAVDNAAYDVQYLAKGPFYGRFFWDKTVSPEDAKAAFLEVVQRDTPLTDIEILFFEKVSEAEELAVPGSETLQ